MYSAGGGVFFDTRDLMIISTFTCIMIHPVVLISNTLYGRLSWMQSLYTCYSTLLRIVDRSVESIFVTRFAKTVPNDTTTEIHFIA